MSFFWSHLQNTAKQSQLFGQAPGKSQSDSLWKQDIRNNVTNNIRICNKIKKKKIKYSVDDIFAILQILSKANRDDMNMKSKKNLRNKHMFRDTSGIGQILLKSHLNFDQFSQVQM